MVRLRDRIDSIIYRLCRSEAPNGFSACTKCHIKRKNWRDLTFKKELLIGYDKILGEWVIFSDYNAYAKIWVMNKYTIKIYTLSEDLWKQLKNLCRKCVHEIMEEYIEPEEENEA